MSELLHSFPSSKPQSELGISSSYCKEAKELFTKMNSVGSPLTEARKVMINNVIATLITLKIWQQLDFLYVWAAHTRGAALIDWKNPNTRSATVVNPYPGDFLADNYFKGNTTNFRIILNYNPGNGGTFNFNQKNNSYGVYVNEHVSETKADIGWWNSASVGCELLTIAGTFSQTSTNNSGTQQSITCYTGKGLASNRRTQDGVWEISRNGYDDYATFSVTRETDKSRSLNNFSFLEFCRTIGGTLSVFSSKKHAYSFAGSGNFDIYNLHSTMEKYYLNLLGITPPKRIILVGNSLTAASTPTERLMVDGNYYNTVELLKRAVSGATTPQLEADAVTKVFNRYKPWLTNDVLFFWELTNHMALTSSNVSTCYDAQRRFLESARTALPNAKIVVGTMMSRKEAGGIVNANRQNDADLLDDTTLNGKIRNHLVADGLCDLICDIGSDGLRGVPGDAGLGIYSNGVPGVGEKNPVYFQADEVHLTTTGYNYLADTWLYPDINSYL